MSQRRKKRRRPAAFTGGNNDLRQAKARRSYEQARELAAEGKHRVARRMYERLLDSVSDGPLRALIKNDLAVLAAVRADTEFAYHGFRAAVALDRNCEPARLNLALLEADLLVERQGKAEGRASRVDGQMRNDEGGTMNDERTDASVLSVAPDRSALS